MPESPPRYVARRKAGLCTTCGTQRAEADRTRCARCRKKAVKTERERRELRIAAGRCRTCGQRAPERDRADCRPCLDRYARYMREREQ